MGGVWEVVRQEWHVGRSTCTVLSSSHCFSRSRSSRVTSAFCVHDVIKEDQSKKRESKDKGKREKECVYIYLGACNLELAVQVCSLLYVVLQPPLIYLCIDTHVSMMIYVCVENTPLSLSFSFILFSSFCRFLPYFCFFKRAREKLVSHRKLSILLLNLTYKHRW